MANDTQHPSHDTDASKDQHDLENDQKNSQSDFSQDEQQSEDINAQDNRQEDEELDAEDLGDGNLQNEDDSLQNADDFDASQTPSSEPNLAGANLDHTISDEAGTRLDLSDIHGGTLKPTDLSN